MKTIAGLSCVGNHGKQIHGTAAILHRMFSDNNAESVEEHEKMMNDYIRLLKQCRYISSDE